MAQPIIVFRAVHNNKKSPIIMNQYAKSLFIILGLLTFTTVFTFYALFQFRLLNYEIEMNTIQPTPPYRGNNKVIITPRMARIIECESGWRNKRDNGELVEGKAGELGIAQFKKSTFIWMSGLAGFSGNIENPYDQLRLLSWAEQNGYLSHWACK